MKLNQFIIIAMLSAALFSSCKKDTSYIYEINKETVYQDASEKQNVKTATEFIAIAYTDIFGESIDFNVLGKMTIPYQAFGDNPMIEDLIIRNFLSDPASLIPADADMRADITAFIQATYLKFYNRNANEFEIWKLKSMIEGDAGMSPEVIYYAILTSDEYRYY